MYLFKPLEFQQIEYEEIGMLAEPPTSHLTESNLRIEDVWNAKIEKSPKLVDLKINEQELEEILLNILQEQKQEQNKNKQMKKFIKINIEKQQKQKIDIENYKQQIIREQTQKIEYIRYEEFLNMKEVNNIDKEFDIEMLIAEIQGENNTKLSNLERINVKRWYEKYLSVKKFVEKNEKLPTRLNSCLKSENLYMWTWRQKAKYSTGDLSDTLARKLEELKDWTWNYKNERLQRIQRNRRSQRIQKK